MDSQSCLSIRTAPPLVPGADHDGYLDLLHHHFTPDQLVLVRTIMFDRAQRNGVVVTIDVVDTALHGLLRGYPLPWIFRADD
jgi:hypothetical protein